MIKRQSDSGHSVHKQVLIIQQSNCQTLLSLTYEDDYSQLSEHDKELLDQYGGETVEEYDYSHFESFNTEAPPPPTEEEVEEGPEAPEEQPGKGFRVV